MRIGEVAERTGVAPATLRVWERRYGVLRPSRTPGGQRVYSTADVARVRAITAQIDSGVRVSAAAQALTAERSADSQHIAQAALQRLWGAIEEFDTLVARASIHEATDVLGTPGALDLVFAPCLRRLGAEWRMSPRNIAREHFASTLLRTHLVELLPTGHGADTCLAFCPGSERHDLGLIMASLAIADHGWHVIVLGADTPLASLDVLTAELEPSLVLVGAAMRRSVTQLFATWRPPRQSVVIGGGTGFRPDDQGRFGVVVHTGTYSQLPAIVATSTSRRGSLTLPGK